MNRDEVDVLVLSTYDDDGAGIFAVQFLRALQELGYTARIVCAKSSRVDPAIRGILDHRPLQHFRYRLWRRLACHLYRADPEHAFVDTHYIDAHTLLSSDAWPAKCGMIVTMFLSGMMRSALLPQIHARYGHPPVMFYGVDMNLYTGGCHYARECTNYLRNCSQCPAPAPIWKSAVQRRFFEKYRAFRKIRKQVVVSASHEHHLQLMASRMFRRSEISNLLMFVDHEVFGVHESERASIKHGYGFNCRTMLIRSSAEPRKGCQVFVDSIRRLQQRSPALLENLHIIAIGDQYIAEQLHPLGIKLYSPGYVADETELARLYCAADFFINSSLADSGPVMLAQAVMSGTPAISTCVGLARNLVDTGINGTLIETLTVDSLEHAIVDFLSKTDEELTEMRSKTQRIAAERLHKDVYLNNLSSIVKRLLGR